MKKLFLLIFLLCCAPVWGATYYVDCTAADDSGNGTTTGTAWKTISKVNSPGTPANYSAGDQILFKRGCTWNETLVVRNSGVTGNPITYGAYGTGALPIIAGANSSSFTIDTNAKSYLVFQYIDANGGSRINAFAGDDLVFFEMMIRNSSDYGITIGATNVKLYNMVIANNWKRGVQIGGSATVTMRNTSVVGNCHGIDYGVNVDGAASLDYDYSIITGNNHTVTTNISCAGTCTDGGHNKTEFLPGFAKYGKDKAYFVFSIDDNDTQYWTDIAAALPSGVKMTYFLIPAAIIGNSSAISQVQALSSAGHEIANHTYGHAYLNMTTAFTVTTANASATINIDRTAMTLTLSTTTPGNTLGPYDMNTTTVGKLSSDGSAKGWTITGSTGMTPYVRLKALASTGGTQSIGAGYTVNVLQSAFFAEELDDAQTAIAGYTGITPQTISYPSGQFNNSVVAYVRDNVGLLAARATPSNGDDGQDVSIADRLSSVPMYWVYGQIIGNEGLSPSSTEAQVRAAARHLYAYCQSSASICVIYAHGASDITATQWGWLADELKNAGADIRTFASAAAAIRADHTTSDNISWTKSYTDVADFRLKLGGSAIDNGVNLGVPYNMALKPTDYSTVDQSSYGTGWDIGPFVYSQTAAKIIVW